MPNATIKKTFAQIADFDSGARNWLVRNPASTKFKYAIERVLKRCQDVLSDYKQKHDEITISNAATDDKGVLLTDERGNFRFKPEGMIKRSREQLELVRSETEIEPYIATEPPKELTVAESDLFMDFVLKERPPEPTEGAAAPAIAVLPEPNAQAPS